MFESLKKTLSNLRKKSRKAYFSGWESNSGVNVYEGAVLSNYISLNDAISEVKSCKAEDTRLAKKPVEIFTEIIGEEPTMNLADLDKQIKLVERRKNVLANELGMTTFSDEEIALRFLLARKKYNKYKHLFKWAVTTNVLIENLCKKYKVQSVNFSSYYKNVPMEAIDEIEKYSEAFSKIRDEAPTLRLIVDDGGKETKKDPILLAGSPFGKWWYLLGAWDKEVEIVDDLIYRDR